MSKTAQKQHHKKKIKSFICTEDGMLPSKDFELVQCFNEKGGNAQMWWVNKKNRDIRYKKIYKDEIEIVAI